MNIDRFFPRRFVSAADLQGRPVTVVVHHVEEVELGWPKRRCLVMYFVDKEKALVLNRTNARILSEIAGPETDHWPGMTIRLVPTKAKFGGQDVDAIRVHPVTAAAGDTSRAERPAPAPTSQAPRSAAGEGSRPRPGFGVYTGRRGGP